MSSTRSSWVVAALILVISGCSKANGRKIGESEQPGGRAGAVGAGGAGANVKSDDAFVHDLALMNQAEIELSRIALDRATRADVRLFAQRMIDEHGAAEDKLKSAVSGQPIDWPAALDDKHTKTADDLTKKQGPDFDLAYAEAMIKGHQDFAAKLESRLDVQSLADWKTAAAGRTQNKALPDPKLEMHDVAVRPDKSGNGTTMKINQWAADTYPVAQKHLDTARALENAMKKRSTD